LVAALPTTPEDIARLARAVCRKVTRYLGQLTGEDKEQQLPLDHLANASVQGLVATCPRRGCRVLRLGSSGEDAEAMIMGKRCADVAGFNVHANVRVGANDRDGLEHQNPLSDIFVMRFGEGKMALEGTMLHDRCQTYRHEPSSTTTQYS
jgi:hypothetical protein